MQDDFNRVPHSPANGSLYQPSGYTVTLVAHLAMSGVIVYTTSQNADSAIPGVVGAVIYFGIAAPASLLILSGTLAAAIVTWLEQRTLQRRDALQWSGADHPRIRVADPVQIPDTDPVSSLPQSPNFVPAIKPVTNPGRREAVAWGLQMYKADGTLDGAKLVMSTTREAPGRLKIAAPRGDARQWLMDREVLEEVTRGLRFRVDLYPTVEEFRTLL